MAQPSGRLEDPLPRWLIPEAGELSWLLVLLRVGFSTGLLGLPQGMWLGSKSERPRKQEGEAAISQRLGLESSVSLPYTIRGVVTQARFKRKGHRSYFLMGGVSEIWGPCFKAQELVSQERSVLPSCRPSRMFKVHLLAVFYGGMKKEMPVKPRLYHLNTVIVSKCPFYILVL